MLIFLFVLGIFFFIYGIVPYAVARGLIARWPSVTRGRLLALAALLMPGLTVALIVLLGVGLAIEDDPQSLDDAAQRSFVMLAFVVLPVSLAGILPGILSGVLANRSRRDSLPDLEAFD